MGGSSRRLPHTYYFLIIGFINNVYFLPHFPTYFQDEYIYNILKPS